MKKLGVLLIVLLVFNFISVVVAQSSDYGTIDEDTGLPKEFSKFSEISQNLSEEEQRKDYLKQEWTKILADKKVIGPFLFYTNKFFTFFNPFWKVVFGIEFEWSWTFVFSLLIWILLIFLIYSPAKGMTNFNPLLSLLFSFIVATLASLSGLIKKAVEMLEIAIRSFWIAVVATAIIVIIIILYNKFMKQWGKKLKEEDEKIKTEQAQKTIQSAGRIAEKELDSHKGK